MNRIYILVEDVDSHGLLKTVSDVFAEKMVDGMLGQLAGEWHPLEKELYSECVGEHLEFVSVDAFDSKIHSPCFYMVNFTGSSTYPWYPHIQAISKTAENIIRSTNCPIIYSMALEYWSSNSDDAWAYQISTINDFLRNFLKLTNPVFFVSVGRASRVRRDICFANSAGTMLPIAFPLIGRWARNEVQPEMHLSREEAYDFSIRKKMFLSLSNCPRPNRVMMVNALRMRGMLELGLVSYNQVSGLFPAEVEMYKNAAETQQGKELIHLLSSQQLISEPILLDAPDNLNFADVRQLYRDTHFSIINETYENDGFALITEKTFKAIIHRHPFMISSGPGVLEYLRVLGYATYDGLFDESYDKYTCLVDRTAMIIENVEKHLNNIDYFEYQISHYREVAEHNYQHFMDFDYGHFLAKTLIYWSHTLCRK